MNSMTIKHVIRPIIILLLVAWMPQWARAASPQELEKEFLARIDELLPGMGAEGIEHRQQPQLAFERICMDNSGPDKQVERAALCRAIMQRVSPDVAMPARVWLLRKVEPIGRAEVVAGLAELLGDPDEDIRELARRALENNPSSEAAAALRIELGTASEELWIVSLINSLAVRRDIEAVPLLTRLCGSANAVVAEAAIAAAGRIADDVAVRTLADLRRTGRPELRDAAMDASFHAAEALISRDDHARAAAIYEELNSPSSPENVRIAALQGLATARGAGALDELVRLIHGPDTRLQLVAAGVAQNIPGTDVTRRLSDALSGASPAAQAVLLDMLGLRGDRIAMEAVAEYLESTDLHVQTAAIGAMRYLGNGSMVLKLAALAAQSTGPQRDAARESLKWMTGQDVDDVILESIGKQHDRVNAELVRAAAVRLMKPALPALLRNVNDPDESVRVPVIYNIGKLAIPQDLGQVLAAFGTLEPGRNEDRARDALVEICTRISDESQRTRPLIDGMSTATPTAQVLIVRALVQLRGQPALETIRSSLKSPSPQVQQAAARALADWGPVYCMEWVFAGPYSKEGATGTTLFDEVFPPERDDAQVEWKPVKGQTGRFVDLEKVAKAENCCGYLRTQLVSEKEQDVILTFGSDDGIKVWLNGQVIHANNVTRGLTVDADKVSTRLNQGVNTLLVKVTQGGGAWAMSCGIQAAEGGPPDGVKFEAR